MGGRGSRNKLAPMDLLCETALPPPPLLQLLLRAKLHVTESQMSYTTILDSTLHCGKKHPWFNSYYSCTFLCAAWFIIAILPIGRSVLCNDAGRPSVRPFRLGHKPRAEVCANLTFTENIPLANGTAWQSHFRAEKVKGQGHTEYSTHYHWYGVCSGQVSNVF